MDDANKSRSKMLARLRADVDQVQASLREMRHHFQMIADEGTDRAAATLGAEGVEMLCRQACRALCIGWDFSDQDDTGEVEA